MEGPVQEIVALYMIAARLIFLCIPLIIAGLISCKEKKDKRLISFNSQFLRDLKGSEVDTINKGDTINYNISREQNGDTISITVDFPWSGCAKFDGNILFTQDSLKLLYFLKNETLCSEMVFYRLNYKVLNREKKDYAISVKYQNK